MRREDLNVLVVDDNPSDRLMITNGKNSNKPIVRETLEQKLAAFFKFKI